MSRTADVINGYEHILAEQCQTCNGDIETVGLGLTCVSGFNEKAGI